VATQQPAPIPPKPPKQGPPEVATAKAEVEIVLLPTTKEVRTTAKVDVPAEHSKRLIKTADRLGHSALGVILVLGTLLIASSAHLNDNTTTSLVVLELLTILGVVLLHRASHGE
jgi:hypothetical protein